MTVSLPYPACFPLFPLTLQCEMRMETVESGLHGYVRLGYANVTKHYFMFAGDYITSLTTSCVQPDIAINVCALSL